MLLAVFNDGAMIALSKDRVVASPVPNHWDLKSIFIVGAPRFEERMLSMHQIDTTLLKSGPPMGKAMPSCEVHSASCKSQGTHLNCQGLFCG